MRDTRLLRPLRCAGVAFVGALGACSGAAPSPAPQPTGYAPQSQGPAQPATPEKAAPDPYHPAPRDTVEVAIYKAWQQYSLQCARCHGEDGQGTSFGPSLIQALKPDGNVPSEQSFLEILVKGREDKGMPSAAKLGIDSTYFEGLYQYLKGRSDGRFHGGRPARLES